MRSVVVEGFFFASQTFFFIEIFCPNNKFFFYFSAQIFSLFNRIFLIVRSVLDRWKGEDCQRMCYLTVHDTKDVCLCAREAYMVYS